MTLKTAEGLLDAGLIAPAEVESLARVGALYAIGVSSTIAALIDRSDPDDPIARQFVPTEAELNISPEEMRDPIGDARRRHRAPS